MTIQPLTQYDVNFTTGLYFLELFAYVCQNSDDEMEFVTFGPNAKLLCKWVLFVSSEVLFTEEKDFYLQNFLDRLSLLRIALVWMCESFLDETLWVKAMSGI